MTAHEEAEQAIADAAAAQAEAAQAKTDAAAAQDAADVEPPTPDTSGLEDAINTLQTAVEGLTEKTADPMTPPEILGGKKSTMSAADLAVLATKVGAELGEHTMTYTGVPPVTLPGVGAAWTMRAAARNPMPYATTIDDDYDDYGDFLMHAFKSGPSVNLTGDASTLKLKGLLTVDGVSLVGVSMKETDKVRTAATTAGGVEVGEGADPGISAFAARDHTTTTTLRADGSSTVVTTHNDTDVITRSVTTTYLGGNKIVEFNPVVEEAAGNPTLAVVPAADDVGAIVTLANGVTITHALNAGADAFEAGDRTVPDTVVLPAADLAAALRTYANANAAGGYMQAAHTLAGYGAWLEDSFFLAYTLTAGDAMAMKVVSGGREHDTDMVTGTLSGFGESATWKGLMAGHDTQGGTMVKGNASITARVGEATLADASAARVPDVVDVSLTNIITGAGAAVSRVADGIHWTNLDLLNGAFSKGSEISGQYYDGGNEVVGTFDKESILGAFGAVEYEAMDMAGN